MGGGILKLQAKMRFVLGYLSVALNFLSKKGHETYKSVKTLHLKIDIDFPGGSVVRNPPANAGDMGLIRDPERSHIPWSS